MDKKVMISLEISETLKEAIRIKSFNERLSVSKCIRKLLEEALADEIKEISENTKNESKE